MVMRKAAWLKLEITSEIEYNRIKYVLGRRTDNWVNILVRTASVEKQM